MADDTHESIAVSLSNAEALDLKRALSEVGDVELERAPADPHSVGVIDPITLIVVPLGALAIQALIVWLAKRRSGTDIEQIVEVRRPDGSSEVRTLRIRLRDSQVDEQAAAILKNLKIPIPS